MMANALSGDGIMAGLTKSQVDLSSFETLRPTRKTREIPPPPSPDRLAPVPGH